jgi:hypothetical protein
MTALKTRERTLVTDVWRGGDNAANWDPNVYVVVALEFTDLNGQVQPSGSMIAKFGWRLDPAAMYIIKIYSAYSLKGFLAPDSKAVSFFNPTTSHLAWIPK